MAQNRHAPRIRRPVVDATTVTCPNCGRDGLYPSRGHWRAPRLTCPGCWRQCIPSGTHTFYRALAPAADGTRLSADRALVLVQPWARALPTAIKDDVMQEFVLRALTGVVTEENAKGAFDIALRDVREQSGFTDGAWLVRPDQSEDGWEALNV